MASSQSYTLEVFSIPAHRHPLVPRRLANHQCDICEKNINLGYSCIPCDYDLCSACFEKNFTTEVKKVPAKKPAVIQDEIIDSSDEDLPKPPKPEKKKPGRGMAKMFHPSNGQQLFDKLDANTKEHSVNITPMLIEAIRDSAKILKSKMIPKEEIVKIVSGEYGFAEGTDCSSFLTDL